MTFSSTATNLVLGDTNGRSDVFVYDRDLDQTTRVSVASDGAQANGDSGTSALSADGRYVAFQSRATNLVAGDTNNAGDVFVHDRQTGQTDRVGIWPYADDSFYPDKVTYDHSSYIWEEKVSISDDGRYVAFASVDSVFVRDRQSSTTTKVSVRSDGTDFLVAIGDAAFPPRVAMSGDGRFVAFDTPNIGVANDTNQTRDVYVHDRQTGQTTRISVGSAGEEGNWYSGWPSISGDGRHVAFASEATTLVPGGLYLSRAVFLHDRQTALTTRLSVEPAAQAPAISADGRRVVFAAVLPGSAPTVQVYLVDSETGSHTLLSADSTPGDGPSFQTAISGNGRAFAFTSAATNLVAGDTSGHDDVFLRTDRAPEPFTDNVLTPGVSLVRAVHMTELRTRIDAQRIRYGLLRFEWTDASLIAGMTATVVQMTELRTALQAAYVAASQTAPSFTDSPIVPGTTVIKTAHIQELRDAVVSLEGS